MVDGNTSTKRKRVDRKTIVAVFDGANEKDRIVPLRRHRSKQANSVKKKGRILVSGEF